MRKKPIYFFLGVLILHIIAGYFFGDTIIGKYANPSLLLFTTLLGFSFFDAYGYGVVYSQKIGKDNKTALVIYRIIQTIVQWGIFVYAFKFSPTVAVLYILGWWFGVCDEMYYLFVKREFKWYFSEDKKDMPWLWWTAYGMLNKEWRNNHTAEKIADSYLRISLLITIFAVKIDPMLNNTYNNIYQSIQGIF